MQNYKIYRACSLMQKFVKRSITSKYSETYYDILKVDKNSSKDDIRGAFIKLSKEYHPDAKGSDEEAARFVKISEAYKILSKPASRSEYDRILLAGRQHIYNVRNATEMHRPWEIKPVYDPNPGSYYGIRGLKRVSNFKIVLLLFGLGLVGGMFGFFSANVGYHYSNSFKANRAELERKSTIAASHHAEVRSQAEKYVFEDLTKCVKEFFNF